MLLLTGVLSAQDPADIFHKTVSLDSIDRVSFAVYQGDNHEFKPWPGDAILIETSVVLNNGQPHILKFFREKNRWDLGEERSGNQLTLKSVDTKRRFVQGTEGTTSETVNIVIYMPETFTRAGDAWQRQR